MTSTQYRITIKTKTILASYIRPTEETKDAVLRYLKRFWKSANIVVGE